MSFCEHCEGQRFDRARVLRALRELRKELRTRKGGSAEEALRRAVQVIRELEIPHLEWEDEGSQVVH